MFYVSFFALQAKANEQEKLQKLYSVFVEECAIILEQPDEFVSEKLGFEGKFNHGMSPDKSSLHFTKTIGHQTLFTTSHKIAGKRFTHCSGWQGGSQNPVSLAEDFKSWITDSKGLQIVGGLNPDMNGEKAYVYTIYGSLPQFDTITHVSIGHSQIGLGAPALFNE